MTTKDIIGLVIVCVLAILIIAASIVLLMGKGSWMIAGYNTSSKEEKEKTDSVALCKFMGEDITADWCAIAVDCSRGNLRD